MRLRSHAEYKSTDAKWIAEIPAHWELVPSNWLFRESIERAQLDDPHLSATQKYGVIPLQEFERLEGRRVTHAFKNLDQRKHAELNDFVISMRSFEGGIERVMAQGCVRSSYIVLHTTSAAHVGYFSYLFKSMAYIQGLQATATFIRDGQDLNFNSFRQIKLPRLGVQEQGKIAAFLDRETARIDALIERKTRFIELLREKRQALITHAVTKGLDAGVQMKDSGVEWLGQVPAHWDIVAIRRVVILKSGDAINAEEISESGAVPVFGGNGVRGFCGSFTHDGEFPIIGRQGALCGNVRHAEGKFWASEHAVVGTPIQELDVSWLCSTLSTMNLNRYATAAAQPGIAVETIAALQMPLPPPVEQSGIAMHIAVHTSRIDTLIAKTERSIELLREKRTALITAAVTGKIDLREVA